VADRHRAARIYVLAGTNGAGKSSVAGAMFLAEGSEYFNPDEAAHRVLAANPGLTQAEANIAAWNQGKRLLQRAIAERLDYAFETTLGGNTIPALLDSALSGGLEVRVWYVGLDSVDLHIARVKARVGKGGHSIPEQKIRDRYDRSRLNLIRLMPRLTELLLYDNSAEADPDAGGRPEPTLLLHLIAGKIAGAWNLELIPGWAKPIVAAALQISGKSTSRRQAWRRPL
jgi:predicted ABC-type ATPase